MKWNTKMKATKTIALTTVDTEIVVLLSAQTYA